MSVEGSVRPLLAPAMTSTSGVFFASVAAVWCGDPLSGWGMSTAVSVGGGIL